MYIVTNKHWNIFYGIKSIPLTSFFITATELIFALNVISWLKTLIAICTDIIPDLNNSYFTGPISHVILLFDSKR